MWPRSPLTETPRSSRAGVASVFTADREAGRAGTVRPTMAPISSLSSRVVGSTPPRMTLPPRRTVTRSAMARASCSLWVMMTTENPLVRSLRRPANRVSTSWGARTLVGSSRMTSLAPAMSTLRISTRWRSPMDRWRTSARGSQASPYRMAASSIWRHRAARSSRMPFRGRARAMFSATVRALTRRRSWNTMPMPSWRATAGESICTGVPPNRSSPESGRCTP